MERTVIESNPNYYGPKAKVKTIVWRPVTEPSTRIVELKSGRADMINRVPSELIKDISGEGMKVLRRQSIWRMGVMLNSANRPLTSECGRLSTTQQRGFGQVHPERRRICDGDPWDRTWRATIPT
jgi:ABC-type transport system substrate-binding protein